MKNNEFRTPLLQSAAVLGGVLILATIAASSGSGNEGGGFFAVLAGIGNTILFVIGLAFGLSFSIALLVGIFLAAVGMVSPDQAGQMYSYLKKNFALSLLTCNTSGSCCDSNGPGNWISVEEYDRMKEEITALQKNNAFLVNTMSKLQSDKDLLKNNLEDLSGENASHKTQIEELHLVVEKLQYSENEIKNLLTDLTNQVQAGDNQDLTLQVDKLKFFQTETREKIDNLSTRLDALELSLKQSPTSGIFSYIEKDEDQSLFIKMVEEAIVQELTYAQIDEYLSSKLPEELDKIIKDHPSLTRNYIRNLRRD